MSATVCFWRRTDGAGLERLALRVEPGGVIARSTLIGVADGGFRLDHRWQLDPGWHAQRVTVACWTARGQRAVRLDRVAGGWCVDGVRRPDLDGAEEPDLSVTPFCNALPVRRLPAPPGATLTLDVAYIDAPSLAVVRSRQRYERLGPRHVQYVDLGVSAGFVAQLEMDGDGLVGRYEGLFERLHPPMPSA